MAVRLGWLAVTVAFTSGAFARGQDKVVGAIWEVKLAEKNVHKFRATPDGKLWNMPEKGKPKVIGTWSGDANNTKMELTDTGVKGAVEIVQIGKSPPSWQGTFKEAGGKERPVKVRLVKD